MPDNTAIKGEIADGLRKARLLSAHECALIIELLTRVKKLEASNHLLHGQMRALEARLPGKAGG